MKNVLKEFVLNLKLEIIILTAYILMYILHYFLPYDFLKNIDLHSYFTQDRLNGIAAFFAITIGVYIAVVTILGTSQIGISKEVLKRRLDKPLIDIIIVGMVENFLSVGLSIFIPLNEITSYVLLIFITVSVVSFMKFIVMIVVIFKRNLEQMAKEIDAEERYKDDMLTFVEEIFRCLKNSKE